MGCAADAEVQQVDDSDDGATLEMGPSQPDQATVDEVEACDATEEEASEAPPETFVGEATEAIEK